MGRNDNTPKRKRSNQRARLMAAEKFIRNYKGKNLIKGYAKWFGVDKTAAIKELELSGIEISEALKKQITESHKLIVQQRKLRKEQPEAKATTYFESDENLAFIVGYTSGGAPYGLTHEEFDRLNRDDKAHDLRHGDDLPYEVFSVLNMEDEAYEWYDADDETAQS